MVLTVSGWSSGWVMAAERGRLTWRVEQGPAQVLQQPQAVAARAGSIRRGDAFWRRVFRD